MEAGVRDRDHRPFQSSSHGIQDYQHDGGKRLRGGAGFGHETLWEAGDFQPGLGESVHRQGIYGGSGKGRSPDQHGRSGALSRQCKNGTLLVVSQI